MKFNFDLFKKHPNLLVAFSEKKDGSMKYFRDAKHSKLIDNNVRNRQNFLNLLGIEAEDIAYAELTHSSNIRIVNSKNDSGIVDNCDGLITGKKNLFLSVTAADCLPIFLFEPEKEIVGMIHAGWRSLEKGILSNAVKKIKDLGGAPENILAGVGPAICQKHYDVGPEVAEKFKSLGNLVSKFDSGKIYLDIRKIAQLQLLELGFRKDNIEISPECTFELPEKYFSARRDKKKGVEAMIAVIGMKE
jgi:YfiH family protein